MWKDVPGYEGLYVVSTDGRVKSVARRKWAGKGWYHAPDRELKPNNSNGYRNVVLSKDGELRTYGVHQLVAMAYLKYTPNGTSGDVVDHIDNDPSNNHISNLQVISHRHNCHKDKKLPGTYYHKKNNKWCAYYRLKGKRKYIGSYNTQEEAHASYLKAISQL